MIDRAGVVIDNQNPHSLYLAQEFAEEFTAVGGIAELIPASRDETIFIKELQSLQKRDVDLLYMPLDAEYVVSAEKLLGEIDWHPLSMGSDGLQATILLQYPESIDMVEGMLATDPYSTSVPTTDYGRKISKLFKENFETPGTVLTALGAEGGSILIAAMNRCRPAVDSSCINRMLRSTKDFIGIAGKISIGEDGKAERPIYLNTIENGHLRMVVKVY